MVFVEKCAFRFLVYLAFQTYYKSFVLITPDFLSVFKRERFKRYDDFVDFSWSEIFEDW